MVGCARIEPATSWLKVSLPMKGLSLQNNLLTCPTGHTFYINNHQ
jgi:hypothetical protein